MAVVGQEEKDGEFCVKDVMVAGLPPQKPLPSSGRPLLILSITG